MAASPSIDRQTFLTYLGQSGLVNDEQLASIASYRPEVTRGRALARSLVEQGILTRFQAERLLMGKTAGFFLGQYRILELLGKGGMGRVYKAEHRTMRRVVALKVLANNLLQTERAVQLFLHEVRAAASLQHPNIVIAYDANEVDGRYYLVLEFVDGPNLDQLVRKQGPLSVGLACDYIRQAAQGLQCAFLQGMVHRDIKPANILVQWRGLGESSAGLVKISDFGLARIASPTNPLTGSANANTILTRDNSVMGTPDYLSPEQARSLHTTDIRSDLYSLGCTLHYLLTGQVPFPGGTALEKIIRHGTETPLPVSRFRDDVPPTVQMIISKLMAKDPAARYPTPEDLANALTPFAVSGPTPCTLSHSGIELPVDFFITPPEDLVEDADHEIGHGGSDADLAAFTNTVSASWTETPVAKSPSEIILRPRRREERNVAFAILLAIALAFGFLALIALLALLSGGR